MIENHIYIAIDLKSFYASVECVERHLDPLTTNLVVADASRTEKTICLAVSPALKAYGISGRARLYEVIQKVKEVNNQRQRKVRKKLTEKSFRDEELKKNPNLAVSFIAATPRMAYYIKYSAKIYDIYLKYISSDDIHVYSIDEVFMDVTSYLKLYQMTAYELAKTMITDIFATTGITATAGIGTNMYLCKVAMDIVAKHVEPDDGVRIAELDEMTYRRLLWDHTPITDFWRVGKGYAKRLEKEELYTMGDIARCSLGHEKDYYNEELLYRMFGVNAELLIDHAWGYESCTIKDIKAYKPQDKSIGSGQVLHEPYTYEKAKLIVKEMIDLLTLDLVDKNLVTDQIVLTVGYDIQNLSNCSYHGEVKIDMYGRRIPKHAHGTVNMKFPTSSTKLITEEVLNLYERIVDQKLFIRRLNISANHLVNSQSIENKEFYEQLDLFSYKNIYQEKIKKEKKKLKEEKQLQQAINIIKRRYGKNSILKGMDLEEDATTMDRNRQIGGHKA